MTTLGILIAILVSGALGTSPVVIAPGPANAPGSTGQTTDAPNRFAIELHDIFFAPRTLTIPADTNATLELENVGAIAHNFSIDELDIDVDLFPGSRAEVSLRAAPGRYEYYCNLPGHEAAGMVGELVAVAEDGGTEGSSTGGAPDEVTIVARDVHFSPSEVTIPADTETRLILPNQGAIAHNFSVDALGVSVDLPVGATEELVLVAPAGIYEFYCDVPGHREAGMVGVLRATPTAATGPPANEGEADESVYLGQMLVVQALLDSTLGDLADGEIDEAKVNRAASAVETWRLLDGYVAGLVPPSSHAVAHANLAMAISALAQAGTAFERAVENGDPGGVVVGFAAVQEESRDVDLALDRLLAELGVDQTARS